MNKRPRELDSEKEAELAVVKKCARLLESVLHPQRYEGGMSYSETLVLQPQLAWLVRKLENDALKKVQTKETLRARLAPQYQNAFFLPNRWSKDEYLMNITLVRSWDIEPPRLRLSADFQKKRESGESSWCGSSLYPVDYIDPTFKPSKYADVESILRETREMIDAIEELTLFLIQKLKLTVYSSNDELLRIYHNN